MNCKAESIVISWILPVNCLTARCLHMPKEALIYSYPVIANEVKQSRVPYHSIRYGSPRRFTPSHQSCYFSSLVWWGCPVRVRDDGIIQRFPKETLNNSSHRRSVPRVLILLDSGSRRNDVSGFNQCLPNTAGKYVHE